MSRRLLLLALVPLLVSSCRHRPPPPMPDEDCLGWIEENFGPQRSYVVALQPLGGEGVFTPDMLQTVDLVTARFEDAQTGYDAAIRSITTSPLFETTPTGMRTERIRDNLPVDLHNAARFRALLFSYEFAVGAGVDVLGSTAYLHLPRGNFEGVDVDALVDEVRLEIHDKMMIAVDGTPGADRTVYREVSNRGPSADTLWVVFSSDEAGGVKTPAFLRALVAFQTRAEALPEISETYSVAEDVMLTRRAVRKGTPAAAVLPTKQAEINQLLMMYQLSGNVDDFGERISADGSLTVVRINLPVLKDFVRKGAVRKVEQLAREGFPPGVTSSVCSE